MSESNNESYIPNKISVYADYVGLFGLVKDTFDELGKEIDDMKNKEYVGVNPKYYPSCA